MKIVKGGVTKAKGFEAAGVEANIKYQGRTDMAIIFSKEPCVAAGTFTTNVAKAAPVTWDQKIVKEGKAAQAIIVLMPAQGLKDTDTAKILRMRQRKSWGFRQTVFFLDRQESSENSFQLTASRQE